MAIGNTDAQKERLWQSARTSEVDAVRRRLDSGQHVALVVGDGKSGDGLGDPVIGRVLGEESERLTSGQRRLGDVRLVVIDCGLYPQPLGALYEALRRVSELLGTGRSGSQVAADRVLAGLRRRLMGDVGEPPPHLALLLAIAGSGLLMRFVAHTDIVALKAFVLGLMRFDWQPLPADPLLLLHLSLVMLLMVVFPISKLLHAPGLFFSPTRYQIDNPREARHVAAWAAALEK